MCPFLPPRMLFETFGGEVRRNKKRPFGRFCAETQDRTVDTAIFSRVLYQLSYLGSGRILSAGMHHVKQSNYHHY